jgi:hypothetical protein
MYEVIANSARKLVDEKYSYPAIAKKLDNIYQEVASGK